MWIRLNASLILLPWKFNHESRPLARSPRHINISIRIYQGILNSSKQKSKLQLSRSRMVRYQGTSEFNESQGLDTHLLPFLWCMQQKRKFLHVWIIGWFLRLLKEKTMARVWKYLIHCFLIQNGSVPIYTNHFNVRTRFFTYNSRLVVLQRNLRTVMHVFLSPRERSDLSFVGYLQKNGVPLLVVWLARNRNRFVVTVKIPLQTEFHLGWYWPSVTTKCEKSVPSTFHYQ